MMTVRFPSGLAVTYNSACFLRYLDHGYELYTADPNKGGRWVATLQTSAGALLEVMRPCAVEGNEIEGAVRMIADSNGDLHGLGHTYAQREFLKRAKRKLRAFNATRGEWSRA